MEVWKDIPDYEGLYQISDKARVKSQGRKYSITERILKQVINNNGYYTVNIHKEGRRKKISIHRILAQLFINNPYSKPQINHKDGNKLNNHLDNLEWATSKENIQHAVLMGLFPIGERHYKSKLTELEIIKIRDLFNCKLCTKAQLSRIYNVDPTTIRDIVNRKNRKHE